MGEAASLLFWIQSGRVKRQTMAWGALCLCLGGVAFPAIVRAEDVSLVEKQEGNHVSSQPAALPHEALSVPELVPTDRLIAKPPLQRGGGNGNGQHDEGASLSKARIVVRLPSLPNPSITAAAYGPERRPREKDPSLRAEAAAPKGAISASPEAKSIPSPSPSPVDKEAVAAFTAYKKRQLDALESDRETLAALQAAIAELGLQEKLSFIKEQIVPSQIKPEAGPAVMPSPSVSPLPLPAKLEEGQAHLQSQAHPVASEAIP